MTTIELTIELSIRETKLLKQAIESYVEKLDNDTYYALSYKDESMYKELSGITQGLITKLGLDK